MTSGTPRPAENGWPPRFRLLGVPVSAVGYDEALEAVARAARARRAACVTHLAVHGLVEASRDPQLRAMLDDFEIVAPDGQPVRRALDALYRTRLPDRCYGPEFMRRVCERAASDGFGIYLYGSTARVVEALRANLLALHPGLRIVGAEPSIFRPLDPQEDEALVRRIDDSRAGVVFLGLGCPLQERFAHAHHGRVAAVQICVGAAFDFHAGTKRMAPRWMQDAGLEWLFRLTQEPRRLWRRYLVTNSLFLWKLARQYGAEHVFRGPAERT